MINVDLGDGLITQMDESQLDGPFFHVTDNDHEHTVATVWHLNGKVVHRSVHVTLKEGIGIEAIMGQLG